MQKFKYIYPQNARKQEQLDIMLNHERNDEDPLAPDLIEQGVLFETEYWFVSQNLFPYKGAKKQYLIVVKHPIYSFWEITPEMWADLRLVWHKLGEEYDMTGGGFGMRFGDPAKSGASLTRVHAHLIMPEDDEKVKFTIGGNSKLSEELHM